MWDDFCFDVCDIVCIWPWRFNKTVFIVYLKVFFFSLGTTSVIVYASAFYGKVGITLLNYMTGFHLSPSSNPNLSFYQSLISP